MREPFVRFLSVRTPSVPSPSFPAVLAVALAVVWMASLSLGAAPACGQTYITEMHVDGWALGAAIRTRAADFVSDRCARTVEGEALCGRGVSSCYLERIEVLGGGQWVRSPLQTQDDLGPVGSLTYNRVQWRQPIRLSMKAPSCGSDPDCPLDSYSRTLDLELPLELRSEGGELCVEPVLPAGFPDLGFDFCTDLSAGGLEDFLHDSFVEVGFGVSANWDRSTIALRREYARSTKTFSQTEMNDRIAAWSDFLKGGIAPLERPGASEWGTWVDKGLLTETITQRFKDQVHEDDDISPDGQFVTSWLPLSPSGKPQLVSYFEVEVVAKEMILGEEVELCPHTIDVDVSAVMPMKVSGGDLVIDGKITWDASDLDVVACGALHLGVGSVVAAVVADSYEPTLADLQDCILSDADDGKKIHCETDLSSNALGVISLTATGLTPDAAALVVYGDAAVDPAPEPLDLSQVEAEGGFSFSLGGDCPSFSYGYYGGLHLEGARLCGMTLLSDGLGVYALGPPVVSPGRTDVEVFFPEVSAGLCPVFDRSGEEIAKVPCPSPILNRFWANPYPARVRLRTTAGHVTVALEPEEHEIPSVVEIAEQIAPLLAQCFELQQGWLGMTGAFNPAWAVDPPEDALLFQGTPVLEGNPGFQATDIVGQAVVQDLVVSPARGTLDAQGRVRFEGARFQLTGSVEIATEAGGVYTVPFSTVVTTDLRVVVDGSGAPRGLEQASAVTVVLESSSLPGQLARRGDLHLTLPAGTFGAVPDP